MYRFTQDQSQLYPVQVLCQTLGVDRSGYYNWRKPITISLVEQADNLRAKTKNARQVKDFGLY